MATSNKHSAVTVTLTAATADTVTLTETGAVIQIIHHGTTTDPIYFTSGGGANIMLAAAAAATPTSEGDNCRAVMSGTALNIAYPPASTACVKLISAGANKYTVQVLDGRLI